MIDKNFVKTWEESILVSCLSGNNLNGESLIRFVYDKKKNKLLRKKQYFIDDRIRDLKYIDEEKILIMLLENKKSLAFLF